MLSLSMAYNVISYKKSKETILLCKFGSQAQKSPKMPKKNFALNRNLLNFFYRYGIFWMVPCESSCPDGSEYVCQRGVGVFKVELRAADVDPHFKKK